MRDTAGMGQGRKEEWLFFLVRVWGGWGGGVKNHCLVMDPE